MAYGPGLAGRVRAAARDGVTAALDLIGTDEAMHVSLALVPDRARSVTIAAFAKGLEAGTKFIGGAPGAVPGTEIRMAARLDLARLAAGGKLKVYVSQTFPLAESAAAHRAIMTSHVTGKLAVLP